MRATLFGASQGDGTGCLRVDIKSDPLPMGLWSEGALSVDWSPDNPLVRLGESELFDLSQMRENTIFSAGIPVPMALRCSRARR
ncbi:MAG TPA: hypothetical protein VM493_02470, partial [Vicinamibacterales bacterium]|nr:hypothetical protein [Vicinamibacterales bacterium]